MICKKCKTQIPDGADFCPNCGNKAMLDSLFCPNCGFKLEAGTDFCSNCGKNIKENNHIKQPMSNNEIADAIVDKTSNFFKTVMSNIKAFLDKHKKIVIIGTICLVTIIGLLFVYKAVFGFEKFSWDDNYEDIKLDYISPSKLSLGIIFNDDKKLPNLKYTVTCGSYRVKGKEISWDLSDSSGICELKIKYKARSLKKKITVLEENPKKDLTGFKLEEIDENSLEDSDIDGLSNKEEKNYKTNPKNSDTDMDGLEDGYEINESKTDPLKADTDGDGVNDYDEIKLGLDPLKIDSKGDGVKDGSRVNNYSYSDSKSGINLELSGKGNIAELSITTYKNSSISRTKGIIDTVYSFATKGKIETAKVTIPYKVEELDKYGITEDELSLYYFDTKTKGLEEVETVIDKESSTITAELKHFSNYVLGKKLISLDIPKNNILMVIDNSISMYTEDQLLDLGFDSITGADGNDEDFKRLDLTKSMIDMFSENYYCAISEFAGTYVKLKGFTNNFSEAKRSVNTIKNDVRSVGNGTNINKAIDEGIKEFTNDDNSHYMLLLTDGQDTSGSLSGNKENLIKKANDRNVHICVIGLGSKIDTKVLSDIATGTGCNYYSANAANSLDEIYSLIGSNINYNLVDIDKDGKSDGTVIADSGFIVNRDGFSFPNYGTNLSPDGHCYGMAMFTELYYNKSLPFKHDSIKAKKSLFDEEELTSYAYNIVNSDLTSYHNLYDYKLSSNILKYTFGFPALGETKPKDLKIVSKDTLVYNTKYKNEITSSKMYDIIIEKSGLSKSEQIKKYGKNYTNAEYAQLDENVMQHSNLMKNDDIHLLNALYAFHISQFNTAKISSTIDPVKAYARILLPFPIIGIQDTTRFIDLIKDRIDRGTVPVLGGNFTGNGGHAINVISIAEDNVDPFVYHLGVYDNNYPSEKRYLSLYCPYNTCTIKANSYYSNEGESVNILPENLIELIGIVF